MFHFLVFLWLFSFIILMGYHLMVFWIREQKVRHQNAADFPGVSIVIAVKNGSDQLMQNLESMLAQDYPLFEIIIVDDHSDPDQSDKLEELAVRSEKILLFHNPEKPGKKQALNLGIQQANHLLILCTDADCRPATSGWIRSMVAQSEGTKMVLGYSPYAKADGLLNLFVRFETLMTAIQYFSWAFIGKAYMGVGRNLLYPKSFYMMAHPYAHHAEIPYGDDDLLVQQARDKITITPNPDTASFVVSDPPTYWSEWVNQKHRHLSAGHHYSRKSWWQPGLYAIAFILHWMIIPILILTIGLNWIFLLFLSGLLIRCRVYVKWTDKLGQKDTIKWYPLLEMGYALYLAGMGIYTLLVKKKSWN